MLHTPHFLLSLGGVNRIHTHHNHNGYVPTTMPQRKRPYVPKIKGMNPYLGPPILNEFLIVNWQAVTSVLSAESIVIAHIPTARNVTQRVSLVVVSVRRGNFAIVSSSLRERSVRRNPVVLGKGKSRFWLQRSARQGGKVRSTMRKTFKTQNLSPYSGKSL